MDPESFAWSHCEGCGEEYRWCICDQWPEPQDEPERNLTGKMYCNHDGKARGELGLRPYHAVIRCEDCGAILVHLEETSVTSRAAQAEVTQIELLDPEEPQKPAVLAPSWAHEPNRTYCEESSDGLCHLEHSA